MTGDDMKAILVRVGTVSALCVLSAACVSVDPFDRTADPTSPAAARVEALARANTEFPRWADFPDAPRNVPTAADIRNRVMGLEADETRLNTELAAIVWTLGPDDLEPWAERTRNRMDLRLAQTLDPEAAADARAWAESQRRRAVPPPPLD